MIVRASDIETYLIVPGLLTPRTVCLSRAERRGEEIETGLVLRDAGIAWVARQLADPSVLLTIHNAPFDLGCLCADAPALLPRVFEAYAAGRVCCTIVRQKLMDVALGMRDWRRMGERVERATYGLDDLVRIYFGVQLDKSNPWRLRFCELDGIPVEEWPDPTPTGPAAYALGDASWHLRLREAQGAEMLERWGGDLPNEAEQQRAAWALHLMSAWGVRADGTQVDRFVENCEREIAKMRGDLAGTGILNDRTGARVMAEIKRRVTESCERTGASVPMTDPSDRFPEGQVKTDKETLKGTDDPSLHVLADSMVFAKHLGQWGPVCRAAVSRPVCARYDVLRDTGRTSCSGSEGQEGTNFQNPPRKGDVRPCFVSRPGWVDCSTDADTVELRALAQNCLEMVGRSRMAEVLWEQHRSGGPDLHTTLASTVLGISPQEALARHLSGDAAFGDARDLSKNLNFGLAGGMGAFKFVLLCHHVDIRLAPTLEEEIERAKELRQLWFETWPEMRDYFDRVAEMIDEDTGRGEVRQLKSNRLRGSVTFAAAANGFFQGRVADAMKDALWRLAAECYTGRLTAPSGELGARSDVSPLLGSRPKMFLHDEPIVEHPFDGSEGERAERQRVIVVESLQEWMPDVPVTSQAVLMLRWHKGAKPVKVGDKLVPSRPEKYVNERGKEATRWVEDSRAA